MNGRILHLSHRMADLRNFYSNNQISRSLTVIPYRTMKSTILSRVNENYNESTYNPLKFNFGNC